jgi:hypothetical protein
LQALRSAQAARYDAPVEPIDVAAVADDFDREVPVTPEIDRFCSSSAWILAAAAALMPPRPATSTSASSAVGPCVSAQVEAGVRARR